jgi:uncharacterized repeat protein (TIGR03803 family)
MQTRAFFIFIFLTLSTIGNAWGASEQVLYSFKGGPDGAYPSSSLVMDATDSLYGVTLFGGNSNDCLYNTPVGCGVVFKLTRSNGSWQESVLYAFQGGADGSNAGFNLIFDAVGNLYGTTIYGGGSQQCSGGCGTVFQLSPKLDGSWTKTILHSFQNQSDGAYPGGLTFDAAGNLYGITSTGGSSGRGTVYELSHNQGGDWTEKVIYTFADFEIAPNPGLTFDHSGNLYGTYQQLYACFAGGCGSVFKLRQSGGVWTKTDLVQFPGGGNGGQPRAGVVLDPEGNIYGTGAVGGNNYGIAFQLKPKGNKWQGIMMHNFCSSNNCADGSVPDAALVMDANRAFYGTASSGGTGCRSCGVVFKLVQTKYGWEETVLHSFQGGADGEAPTASLILDASGNLYGTNTGMYGIGNYGIVFEIMQ